MKTLEIVALVIALAATFGCRRPNKPAEPKSPETPAATSETPAPSAQRPAKAITTISPQQLKEMLDEKEPLILVDVRMPGELASLLGKIEGVINIPLGELPARYGEIDPQKKIVLICRSGHRSMKAAEFLSRNGYAHLYSLDGGMTAWKEMLDAKNK